ncbi:MAG: hypothetical protein ACE5I7_15220 [Candidatus Binatia bacterium]
MKQRAALIMAGALVAFAGTPRVIRALVQACPDNCAGVTIGVTQSQDLKPGDTFGATLTFNQGPDDGQTGGIDEIAALALTLGIPGTGAGTPLELADCTLDAEGLPNSVTPDPAISNFKVVVENASCANGRTHCLCPDAGQPRDDFINLVFYGPNPLPTPGPGGIEIPVLPAGPQNLVTIDLKVAQNVPSGVVALHVFNQVTDSEPPQFAALLSVGDKEAVDQTCVPVTGQPPCSATDSVSQVTMTDASVTLVGPPSCVGDCDGGATVTVNELISMVNVALGNTDISACTAGDQNGDGMITINEIISAVNNALGGCPVQ